MNGKVRNLHFGLEDVPRHWHGGRKSITAFFDGLSVFFPAGERFFVASVRAHQNHVQDPHLAEDVRTFCGQEGVHAREHRRYNELLRRQGYPVDSMERRVEELLGRVTTHRSRVSQLAVTCALEHFTAMLGQMLLGEPRLLDGAHPGMAALWRWHAAEENEHKAVAFDVYTAAGGGYGRRAATMVGATVIFWAKVLEHQIRMMRADGTSRSLSEWWALAWFLFVDPGKLGRLVWPYLNYFRPGFHPSDLDTAALVEGWRNDFATSPEYADATAA